jgi:hypothetical protein
VLWLLGIMGLMFEKPVLRIGCFPNQFSNDTV